MSLADLTDKEVLAAYESEGSFNRAAKLIGCARSTFTERYMRIKAAQADEPKKDYTAPELLESDLSADEIIARNKKSFERRMEAARSRDWMEFHVKIKGPFALVFVGDPHADDNGCNWPLLERDVAIIRETDAMYGIGLGDYTNNWSGRLQRIYANQETTRNEAWKLAEWFFGQKKPNGQSIWWLLLKGNHDLWSSSFGNGDPLDWMKRGSAALEDWQAKFQAVSGDVHVPIWAAHDFKGSSIWNPLHGPMRKGFLHGGADIYVCGDKHNWGIMELESQENPGRITWAIRARGYKYLDSHASRLGFGSQDNGASIAVIVDPDVEGPRRLRCIPDLEEAADFLKFKRRGL